MKKLLLALILLGSVTAVILCVSTAAPHLPGKLLSIHPREGLAFVVIGAKEAEELKKGDVVYFETEEGRSHKGRLISKETWFHRTMAKVKIENDLAQRIKGKSLKR